MITNIPNTTVQSTNVISILVEKYSIAKIPNLQFSQKIYYTPVSEHITDNIYSFKTSSKVTPSVNSNYWSYIAPWSPSIFTPKKIQGKVTERDIKNVSYQDVYLTDMSLNRLKRTCTNSTGDFWFTDLPPGDYTVIVVDKTFNYNAVILSGVKIL